MFQSGGLRCCQANIGTCSTRKPKIHPSQVPHGTGESFVVTRSFRGRFLSRHRASMEEFIAPLKSVPRKTSEDTLCYSIALPPKYPRLAGENLLPRPLVEHAGIIKEACIIGCGDYGEIWFAENMRPE